MLENRHFTKGKAECGPVSGCRWGVLMGDGWEQDGEEEEEWTAFYKAMMAF